MGSWECFEASCAIRVSGMNVHLYCHQGGSSARADRLKQVWFHGICPGALMCFLYFYSWSLEDATEAVLGEVLLSAQPLLDREPVEVSYSLWHLVGVIVSPVQSVWCRALKECDHTGWREKKRAEGSHIGEPSWHSTCLCRSLRLLKLFLDHSFFLRCVEWPMAFFVSLSPPPGWAKLTLLTVQTEGPCSHNGTTVAVTALSE